jgi:hypothetical protein
LAQGVLYLPTQETPYKKFRVEVLDMNIVLPLLNAVALVVLVTVHFQGSGSENEQVSVQVQTDHPLRQAAQFAVMTNQYSNKAMLANDSNESMPMSLKHSERWVF